MVRDEKAWGLIVAMMIRKLEALFTLRVNRTQFNEAFSGLQRLESKAQAVMSAFAGYWAVGSFHNFVSHISQLGKNASYIGVTTESLQELRFAAENTGISIDALEDALKEIQIRAVDASSGTGEAAEAFNKLGLKSTDASGRIKTSLELLDEVADKMKTLPTKAERLWVSDAIFGDEGSKMLLMIEEGSWHLKNLREEARSTGRILGNESVAQAERLIKALHGLKHASVTSAQAMSAPAFAPLAKMFEFISGLINGTMKVSKTTSEMAATGLLGSLALAAAKVVQALLPVWPAIKSALMIGGSIALRASGVGMAVLLLHDLWSFFNNADSVTGRFAQGLDKAGTSILHFASIAKEAFIKGFEQAFLSIAKEFDTFASWFNRSVERFAAKTTEIITNLVPDFLKGKKAVTVTNILSDTRPQRAVPATPKSFVHTNNINVAVDLKSEQKPHNIGQEIAHALRRELEKERFNAYMGVSQYAG